MPASTVPPHQANSNRAKRPSAALVGVLLPGTTPAEAEASLVELERLVDTWGYDTVAGLIQKRAKACARTLIGEGKLREICRWTGGPGVDAINEGRVRRKVEKKDATDDDATQPETDFALDGDDGADEVEDRPDSGSGAVPDGSVDIVVFDHELSPTQLRNLERATGVPVYDRTGVIVEIFHRHAHTREARLQVEIARLRYMAPRLSMMQAERGVRERQGGGVGGRGSGESALETDRRKIRDRIVQLERELEDIRRDHQVRRERRRDRNKVALVGYTNAGKSSLMRALTGSEVYVENKLFATLDTTVRALQPETVPRLLVSDTVGFINKLPHDLVASFRTTLDEAADASLVLHVVDGSDPDFRAQMRVTREVLADLDAGAAPRLIVLNKADRLDAAGTAALRREFPEAVILSCLVPEDVARLRRLIIAHFEAGMVEGSLRVSYERGAVVGEIRQSLRVLAESHDETGSTYQVKGYADDLERIRRLLDA